MQGNVSVEPFDEGNSLTSQDRNDRLANLVGEPEPKAFAGNRAASNDPDTPESRLQSLIHQPREVS